MDRLLNMKTTFTIILLMLATYMQAQHLEIGLAGGANYSGDIRIKKSYATQIGNLQGQSGIIKPTGLFYIGYLSKNNWHLGISLSMSTIACKADYKVSGIPVSKETYYYSHRTFMPGVYINKGDSIRNGELYAGVSAGLLFGNNNSMPEGRGVAMNDNSQGSFIGFQFGGSRKIYRKLSLFTQIEFKWISAKAKAKFYGEYDYKTINLNLSLGLKCAL